MSKTLSRSCSHCAVPVAESSRSEEHTSELQSPCNLVCRLLLEKKNIHTRTTSHASLARQCAPTSPPSIAQHPPPFPHTPPSNSQTFSQSRPRLTPCLRHLLHKS